MATRMKEREGRGLRNPEEFHAAVVETCQPIVLRGLVADWPAVRAASISAESLGTYLAAFDAGGATEAFVGEPANEGRYYYADGLKGFNFERRQMGFGQAVREIVSSRDQPGSPTMYVGSVPVNDYLPGFSAANPLPALPAHVAPRIWIGHASKVSSHFDTFENVACVVAGRRRFTLYPPEAIARLYVGPIDNTMAGQPVSLAASEPIDDEKYPLFRDVRDQALVAELEPGDAIFMPKLWWHQVESTAGFNTLINYWWDAFQSGPDAPYTSLLLSMIAIAERPARERQAWKAFFDHYVFRPHGHPLSHLPPEQHGMLGPLRPDNYGKIRAVIMHRLRGGRT